MNRDIYQKEYYQNNKDSKKAYALNYYQKNKERCRQLQRIRRKKARLKAKEAKRKLEASKLVVELKYGKGNLIFSKGV